MDPFEVLIQIHVISERTKLGTFLFSLIEAQGLSVKSSTVAQGCTPSTQEKRQDDEKFKVVLDYMKVGGPRKLLQCSELSGPSQSGTTVSCVWRTLGG